MKENIQSIDNEITRIINSGSSIGDTVFPPVNIFDSIYETIEKQFEECFDEFMNSESYLFYKEKTSLRKSVSIDQL